MAVLRIEITETGVQPQYVAAAAGDWVIWTNPNPESYTVGNFTGPSGAPQLFRQTSYTLASEETRGGLVLSNVLGAQYSYTCSAGTGGAIVIIDRPGTEATEGEQKKVQRSSSVNQAEKQPAEVNGSRR